MNRPDYKTYRMKITVLTPMHIGNGKEMLNDYDYAIHGGRTWRIDENALLDAQDIENPQVAEMLMRTKPAHLLKPQDFVDNSPYFRYVLKGTPKSKAEGAVVQEQIKDAYDHPYLPGSTVKGALRTALAWYLWGKKNLHPEITKLGGAPKFAALNYEREIFGKNPNNDLMRALHVTDSAPLDISALMLINVRVLTYGGKPGSPVELEAIRRDSVFECDLKLDTVLFSEWAKKRELYLPNAEVLLNFVEVMRQYSQTVIQRQLAWARQLPSGKNIVNHYNLLLKQALHPGQFFLQLGWGGGWEQKTFGDRLKQNEAFMRTILKPKKQGGWDVGRGHMPKNIKDFPTSRRIAMAYQRDPNGEITGETPALPLGWTLAEIVD